MTKARMMAKPRNKDVEAPGALREEVAEGLDRLGDPLGDVFAVLDQAELNDLLNRVGKTQRTQLLQRLRVPAMGRLTPMICGHALAQLRSQQSAKYRLLAAQVLGGPLYEGLSHTKDVWVAGTGDEALVDSLEQAPRAELLLTALAFWNRDPGHARVLAWAMRHRALPSWPAAQVAGIADACDRLAAEWADLHSGAVPGQRGASPAEDIGQRPMEQQLLALDDARDCEAAAAHLDGLFNRAAESARQTADHLEAGKTPVADCWQPIEELLEGLAAIRAGLNASGAGPDQQLPADRDGLCDLLRERARLLDDRQRLLLALVRCERAVSVQEHPGLSLLKEECARLRQTDTWDTNDTRQAELVAEVIALADAVARDDEALIEELDARLRSTLPTEVRPVVLLVLRGKVGFPPFSETPLAPTSTPTAEEDEAERVSASAAPPHVTPALSAEPDTALRAPAVPPQPETEPAQSVPAPPAQDASGDQAGLVPQPQEDGPDLAGDHVEAVDPMPEAQGGQRQHPTADTPPEPQPEGFGQSDGPSRDPAAPLEGAPAGPGPAVRSDDLVARILRQDEAPLAYHCACALGASDATASLRLFVLADAMRTATGSCAESVRLELVALTGVPLPEHLSDRLLRAAALFRTCLVSADPAAGELLRPLADSLYELPALRATLAVVAEACARGQLSVHVVGRSEEASAQHPDADVDVSSVTELASKSLVEPRSLHFPRANEIIREWWSEIGPIGCLLHAVARDDRARLDVVRSALLALRKPDALEQQLTTIDNQKRHKKPRLQGAARRRILQYAQESLDYVHQWLTAVQNLDSFEPPALFAHLAERIAPHAAEVEAELSELHSASQPMVAAAAERCRTAMRTSVTLLRTGRLPGAEPTPMLALNADLLRCSDLEFDAELIPRREVTCEHVQRALETEWEAAAHEHAAAENYATARTALDMFELHGGPAERVGELREEHHRLRAATRQEVGAVHREVQLKAETAARLGQLREPGRSLITARLEAARASFGDDNLGTIRRECDQIVSRLEQLSEHARNEFQTKATKQLNEWNASASLADEIRALIRSGDLATAEEFLIAARAGDEPPTVDPVTDFDAFYPAVCEALPGGVSPELIKDAANGAHHRGLDFSALTPAQCSQAAEALTAFLQMHSQWNSPRSKARHHLRLALRLAGIEYDKEDEAGLTNPPNRRWFDITDVKLVGAARLPQFGSGTNGRLRVMTTRSMPDARTLMGWIEQDVSQLPVLVAVAGAISVAQRRAWAKECVSRRDKPILILDACALAFLASRGTGLFATTERILAPFSAVSPYFPEASDTLPEEMFYGRTEELSAVLNDQGSSILYGGRRLGKSALLKAAAARYRNTRHHESLYIPLPSGMGLTPEQLWDLLTTNLERSGIAQRRKHRASTVHQVEKDIDVWLNEDKARRLLILFDECDEFFDGDARTGFQHTTALRNLMSANNRRFKPVFAGLHQVQRFAALPNQPLAGAHFGEPLVIGPLSPSAAYRLLHEPMQALGIRFQNDRLIHRALAYSNYHPKIIQHIGLALVHETHSCRTADDGPPWIIDDDMLERVIGSATLDKSIRDTVRLTLHLDPRYKLIALVLALHAYRNGVDQPVAGRELRTECTDWWPHALSATTPDEYRALLEEMVGLGVLAADETGWRLRSSNVLRLLGTPAGIEEELSSQESETVTALSATHARRLLTGNRISPLTEAQIAELTARRNGLRIVIGTPASGLDDVLTALTSQQERVSGRIAPLITPTKRGDYRKQLQAGTPGRSHRIIVSDMREFSPAAMRTALKQAVLDQPPEGVSRCVIALIDPSNLGHLRELGPEDEEHMVFLRLATTDGLRSWTAEQDPMAPFSDPTQCVALLKATGGWASLLNHTLGLAISGQSPQKVLAKLTADLEGPAGAQLVEDSGLGGAHPLHPLIQQLSEFDEPLPFDDLVELLGPEHPHIEFHLGVLRRMNMLVDVDPRGLAVEPVLAKAWQQHGTR
ncbi:hypothetical protein [Streptomyces sp. NBC_01320]|uniref:hypothetical protein n=1 Tax=Streptomyces sp. NBC_01320 TaxID=2903824 RepID=UPI002E15EAF9|nr:hypothetical protein OG395_04755 [Streptomyces sp. NBC_01320]